MVDRPAPDQAPSRASRSGWSQTGREAVEAVLRRQRPSRFVYAPNYWQWFSHHQEHGTLPGELQDCRSQLDLLRRLGVDVFSRNLYCDHRQCWFGGLASVEWDGVDVTERRWQDGKDWLLERTYHTRRGSVTERLRYLFDQSTLIQERFAIDDYANQLDVLEEILKARRWRFDAAAYHRLNDEVGDDGLLLAGELHSPLKMLHLLVGPENTTFLLLDFPERTDELLKLHEAAQLDLTRQMVEAGVRVVVSMDNLDAAFHTPSYVERCSASFYEQASRICHEHGSLFFIHACGRQKANLTRIASYGVDGLEGVAFPPLGDVELDEAMERTGDRFLITGGISAAETDRLQTREQVFDYVRRLFERMRPYAHRFVFSSSCNTAITARWSTLVDFRDAWLEYGELT